MKVDVFKVGYLIVQSIENILTVTNEYLHNEDIAVILTYYFDSSIIDLHFYAATIGQIELLVAIKSNQR
jgi:hypothetical protein